MAKIDNKEKAKDADATPGYVAGRVGVVGLGLMGGSFARAFRAADVDVYAWNRTRSTLELAEIETVRGELTDEVVGTCELIILAGYPQSAIDWLAQKADLIAEGAIVIDTVGVKRIICEKCGEIARAAAGTSSAATPWRGPSTPASRTPARPCSKARRWSSCRPRAWTTSSASISSSA